MPIGRADTVAPGKPRPARSVTRPAMAPEACVLGEAGADRTNAATSTTPAARRTETEYCCARLDDQISRARVRERRALSTSREPEEAPSTRYGLTIAEDRRLNALDNRAIYSTRNRRMVRLLQCTFDKLGCGDGPSDGP